MPPSLTTKYLRLVKTRRVVPFLQRICEEVFHGHLAIKPSIFKKGLYWNDPDIYCLRCLVCGFSQLMDKEQAKAFLKKCFKGEHPDIRNYGLQE